MDIFKHEIEAQALTDILHGKNRAISDIAYDIKKDWKNVYFGAVPYLEALTSLTTIHDKYIMDDAKSLIIYFLSNAKTYRGENAKKYKAELKKIAGIK